MKKIDFTYDIERHEKFFFDRLSEKDRRLYVGLEAMKAGYYGVVEVSARFSVNKHTVRKGKNELLNENVPEEKRTRKKGGGRKKKRL